MENCRLPGSRPVVVMAGPDVDGRGGMASVTRLLLDNGAGVADIRFVRTHVDGSISSRLWTYLTAVVTIGRALGTRRVDVLHLHIAERGSVLRKGLLVLLARAARVGVVLHTHGAEFVPFYQGLPSILRHAVARVFRAADLVLVLGDAWQRTYHELLGVRPDRIVVLRNPVALPTSVPDRGPGPVGVVFLGRYGQRKGSGDLLAAVAQLAPEVRARLRLRMAGDGELAATTAMAADIDADIEVSGWLDATARDAELAAAQVFVLPSRDEGLPMAMLEAMAWGLVPVVTPVGSIEEVVHDNSNGLLVTPGDVAGLSAVLHRLLTDDEERHQLAAAARKTALDFGVSAYMEVLGAHWRRIARDHTRDLRR